MNRAALRDELARLILGETPTLTRLDVAEQGGLAPEQADRLWRALGFPDPGESTAYGEADVEALAVVAAALDSGLFDETTILRMTRGLGQTMARLADWQVSSIVQQMEAPGRSERRDSRLESAVELAQVVSPGFERLLLYAWRRHLAAATARVEALGAAESELLTTTMTVGFADLSRFTALSNELDDHRLGALVERFEDRTSDLVTARSGRVIKTLGDAILFVHDDPAEATSIALEMVHEVGARDELPAIRVALATGTVVSRLGDVFGPPVNLAARLSRVARSNRVLVDAQTADALDPAEFEYRRMPPRQLRGFGTVAPITVSRRRRFRARTT